MTIARVLRLEGGMGDFPIGGSIFLLCDIVTESKSPRGEKAG
jgi:hypothetical protein